eukprot:TRINITY_DN6841_c1_g2_i1.p1 TRINITY_DN6841_c1_g2~~TRINITY_DN6841_c1_g2_i1.p1  ORF type:complete len:860 (+),score=168.55 TRINITY_DN6841_c1_g2_i1:73-2652(+)
MGLGFFHFFGSFLVLAILFRPLASHPPNTDGFFLSDFFQKMGLNSTSTFNLSAPVCSWKGAICDAQNQSVTGLAASGLGLSGSIPEDTIAKLKIIQYLDLSNNYITDFSADFWSLGSTLISLNLSFNQIHVSLPSNVGNFVQLKSLDLSCNSLSSEIPAAIGSLSSLQILNLSRNSFEGTIPSGILNCKDLVSLDLSWNRLSGKVPTGFGAALANLSGLNLARNEIRGRVSDFSGLKSLTYLNLSSNMFHGPVVGVFQGPLKVIDLSQNHFHGHISQVNFNSSFNWASLVFLDLSENQLSGEFFSEFNQAQSLEHLNLAHNRFSDQNFPHIDKLLNIEYLNLSKTNLRGLIPTEVLELGGLKTLDLSHNHLTGSVPDLSGNGDLQVLDLSHNNLTGEIPLLLVQKLPQMAEFNFSYNNVSLCAAKFSPELFMTAFSGAQDDCPIAANPALFRRNKAQHKELMPALAIMFSILFCLAGFICLVFSCRRSSWLWAVKQLPRKEVKNASGPFSFQTDSTTWVADVKLATSVPAVVFNKPLLNLTFADLLSATSHFNREALLAEGRFGPVYRGFLPGGVNAAIKVLVHGSTMTDEEIARELERLGRIKHPNLVPLIGYCLAGDQRIAMYEYMENGNLQNLLYDLPLGIQKTEDWSMDTWEGEDIASVRISASEGVTTWTFRHKIALGTARALSFLHHGCFPSITHRDVKASSIYLGSSLEPRLSYSGLAKIVESELDENELSMVSPGYSPPEFSRSELALATLKSDVYAYGVVLFELITGKKPVGDDYPDEKDSNLVNWVRGLVRKNQGLKAIDPKIRGTGSAMQIVEALRIGYLCTADLPLKRPNMQQIVGLLKDIDPAAGR